MAAPSSQPSAPPGAPVPPAAAGTGAPVYAPVGSNLPTIVPVWHQLPQLDPPPVTRFLLWLSKTDIKAIAHCTPESLMGQTSLGAMVLLTGILALGSSFFTVWTIVEGQWGPALLVPLIYAFAIMMFDRELVGFVPEQDDRFFKKFFKMLPRLGFAAVLGYAIAIPVELKVMERRIEAEIRKVVQERSADKLARIADIRKEGQAARDQLKATVSRKDTELRRIQESMDIEFRARGGRGRRYEAFEGERTVAKAEYDAAIAAYQAFDLSGAQTGEVARYQAQIDAEYDALRRDMLARVEALHGITERNPAAWRLATLLTTVFMLLELFPMILKLFSRYNEYHAYLHARREINIQKAHVLANYALQDIATNPRHAALYGEYTDLIQLKSEDPVGLAPGTSAPGAPAIPGSPPLPAASPFNLGALPTPLNPLVPPSPAPGAVSNP
jgi:hypothetical protein